VSNDLRTREGEPAVGPRSGAGLAASSDIVSPWLLRLAWAGVVLFFVAACAWGVLEVHYSTDTWIGLAAGRQIMTEPRFPKADTFSYTFYGQPWFNQNWLSHVFFWSLYSSLGSTALVIGTWAVSVGTFTLVLGATWFRSRSWLAAFLAAAMVAIASRDWLSIRPATIQFFFLAAAWISLSALLGQGERRRWWPIAFLLVVFGIWPHAHGSFVIGFAMLGLFLGCAAAAGLLGRIWPAEAAISLPQGIAMACVGVVTAILGVVLSPYGIENFTHSFKVVESDVFRQVGEWLPPYRPGQFPGVTRFWIFLAVAGTSPLVLMVLRGLDRQPAARRAEEADSATAASRRRRSRRESKALRSDRAAQASNAQMVGLHALFFDLASVGIGLYMAMFARRFAPLFYIVATPVLVSWIVLLARPLSLRMRRFCWTALMLGAWVGGLASVVVTSYYAHRELAVGVPHDSKYDLLDRVTLNFNTPQPALEFLRRNGLKPNVMTEWKTAAAIMFEVPGARVFIDGRAQQVYDEGHFLTYTTLLRDPPPSAEFVAGVLDRSKTEAILLPKWKTLLRLGELVNREPEWVRVLDEPKSAIWVRRESPLLDELIRRERAGDLWWPDYPETQKRRALWIGQSQ
jgi:hypothetical protein